MLHSSLPHLSILKSALLAQSFVIEEIALADLIERAWRPVGKKIRQQLSKAIDFKKGTFSGEAPIDFELWITADMVSGLAQEQWDGIETKVQWYILRAYDRAWKEKGRPPWAVSKADDAEEDDWEELLDDISREGSTLDKKESVAGKVALAAALMSLARESFLSHARDVAVPAVQDSISALRKLQLLEQEEELSRKEREALTKARENLIEKLSGILDGAKQAAGTANVTVARAHHFGFLDWATESQVEYYQVCSVLDSKLCGACEEMNGKIFAVADALQFKKIFLAAIGDKELMKREVPFLTLEGAQGARGYVVKKSGEVFYFPPFHPRCRCTVVAIYENVVPEPYRMDSDSLDSEQPI